MYSLKEIFMCVVDTKKDHLKYVKYQERETLSLAIGHVYQKTPKILKGLLLPLVSPIIRTGFKCVLPEIWLLRYLKLSGKFPKPSLALMHMNHSNDHYSTSTVRGSMVACLGGCI